MNRTPTMRGGVLILIILIMLSLSIFSVLSMVSANGDYKLAQKNAEFVSAYYRLDAAAAGRYQNAYDALRDGADFAATLSGLGWTMTAGEEAELTVSEDTQHITLRVRYTDNALHIIEWRQWQDSFDYSYIDEGDTF